MNRAKLIGGGTLLFLFVAIALCAPLLAPYDPAKKNLEEQLLPPSASHGFGQNQHGEDLLSIVIVGSRASLLVGLCTVACSMTIGILLGLISGYFRGHWDAGISRVIEIILAFPGMLLAIAIAAVLGASIWNVVLALTVGGWVAFARLARAQTFSLREREFIVAERSLGATHKRILFRHILPQLWSPIIVQATFALAAAILAESSLSFLGLGSPAGTPSWGAAVADGVRYLLRAPHLATFPGLAIMLTVLSLNLFGDGLRDWLNERG